MSKDGLYLIAILPPDDINQRVQAVQKEFADDYDSKKPMANRRTLHCIRLLKHLKKLKR
ncbi:MAG: hypothetical protein U5J63_07780 [Fodinibius sp.]|nr:hypothetical protein [Fodinibius sp.]